MKNKLLALLLCCSCAYAETTDELKARFEKEIENCFSNNCQLAIANKLYLLLLIEQMKENGKK